jgi:hypothetical protein
VSCPGGGGCAGGQRCHQPVATITTAAVTAITATHPALTARRRRIVVRYAVGSVSCNSTAGSRPTRLAAPIPAASGNAISSKDWRTRAVPRLDWPSRAAPSIATARSVPAAINGGRRAAQPARRISWRHSDSGLMRNG